MEAYSIRGIIGAVVSLFVEFESISSPLFELLRSLGISRTNFIF